MPDPTPSPATPSGSWSLARRLLVVVAVIITAIALTYAVIDWRGKRAWEAYQSARGALPEFAAFIPPPVPDEQNFAMTPFLAPLFDFNPLPLQPGQSNWRDTNGHNRVTSEFNVLSSAGDRTPATGVWRQEHATDLGEWVRIMRKAKAHGVAEDAQVSAPSDRQAAATALLGELERFRPVLEELRQASQRPQARFNIRYNEPDPWSILLPHLAVLRGASHALQLRASAELALANPQAALEDVHLIFHLAGTIKDEPFLITHLVRIKLLDDAVQTIWEGLEARRWSDAQLQDFQAQLGQMAVLRDLQMPLGSERAADNLTFELLRTQRDRARMFSSLTGAGDSMAYVFLLAPRGWIYQEQVTCNRLFDDYLTPGFDPAAQQIKPDLIDARTQGLGKVLQGSPASLVWNHLVMARLLLPALGRVFQKSAMDQTGIDQAALACALERHRLATGRYPESLDALKPRFIQALPHDVCNGEALKYRVTQDGRFILYSVGWNEKDDGGVVAVKGEVQDSEGLRQAAASGNSGPTRANVQDPAQGDWVWQYPTNAP